MSNWMSSASVKVWTIGKARSIGASAERSVGCEWTNLEQHDGNPEKQIWQSEINWNCHAWHAMKLKLQKIKFPPGDSDWTVSEVVWSTFAGLRNKTDMNKYTCTVLYFTSFTSSMATERIRKDTRYFVSGAVIWSWCRCILHPSKQQEFYGLIRPIRTEASIGSTALVS